MGDICNFRGYIVLFMGFKVIYGWIEATYKAILINLRAIWTFLWAIILSSNDRRWAPIEKVITKLYR